MSTCLQCFYRDLLCHCFSFGITQWRCPSCETPLGSRAKQDGCFRRCTVTELWGMLCFWEWTTRKLFKILSKKIGNCTSQSANRKWLNVMFINDVSSYGIPDWENVHWTLYSWPMLFSAILSGGEGGGGPIWKGCGCPSSYNSRIKTLSFPFLGSISIGFSSLVFWRGLLSWTSGW